MKAFLPQSWIILLVPALLAACASTDTRPPPQRRAAIAPVNAACAVRPASAPGIADAGNAEQSMDRVVVSAEPESASSLVSRAWERSRGGDRDGTVTLFDLALTRPDHNMALDRIRWSYGWAMFNLGDHRCALAHFEQARQVAPDQIRWLPQTLAVTYWQLGERDVALNWYDEAAKNEPGCWIDAKAAARCTRHWLRQEKRALGELLTEWKRKRIEMARSDK